MAATSWAFHVKRLETKDWWDMLTFSRNWSAALGTVTLVSWASVSPVTQMPRTSHAIPTEFLFLSTDSTYCSLRPLFLDLSIVIVISQSRGHYFNYSRGKKVDKCFLFNQISRVLVYVCIWSRRWSYSVYHSCRSFAQIKTGSYFRCTFGETPFVVFMFFCKLIQVFPEVWEFSNLMNPLKIEQNWQV